MQQTIAPHGGRLVNRIVEDGRREALLAECRSLPRIRLSSRQQCDLEMIAVGAFSPLEGFMCEADFHSVCDEMRLAGDGVVWPIPITCSVDERAASQIEIGQRVCLTDEADRPLAVLTVEDKFRRDKDKEAEKVYLTRDRAHPGVAALYDEPDVCLGGPVEVICANYEPQFPEYRLTPEQTRREFAARGWRTVVGFQTRNPIHRAHEYLTKCALEICDGLLIHPLVGRTKSDDVPAEVRMRCYEVLVENYYNRDRVLLAVMPAAMRYAGPREAVLHALVRKNYGCTHFIVGRDHAGTGNYYGTYDAQRIFDEIDPQSLGIVPLRFEHAVWCRRCQAMVTSKTCPHGESEHVFFSGTRVRDMLRKGQVPPPEFTRPEVARILLESYRACVG